MLSDERREFGSFLRKLRVRRSLTLRGLAETSGVPFPNISAIECGRLGAGPTIAAKLAAGLDLKGKEKKNFLNLATFTTRDRLAKDLVAYPALLANLLPRMLKEAGIKPTQVINAAWQDAETFKHPSTESPDSIVYLSPKPEVERYLEQEFTQGKIVLVYLKDGRQVLLHCKQILFGNSEEIVAGRR